MKNRILIIGNNDFSREYYENGNYKINNKKYINTLYKNYDIDNLSNSSLDSCKAYKLSKAFILKYKYSACIISFGIEDLKKNSLDLFEENLQNILNMVSLNGIECILLEVDKSKDLDVEMVNRIIRKYKSEFNLNYGLYDKLIMNKVQFCN